MDGCCGRQVGPPSTWTAQVFVDASYDGDLAVQSGVSYTYGRESNETYGESLAGVQPFNHFQNFLTVCRCWGEGLWTLATQGSCSARV